MSHDTRNVRRVKLAQQILQLIQQGSWEKGHHLKEQALADTLGVSRSPVRAALMELEKWGALSSRPNHGFFLCANSKDVISVGQDVPPTAEEDLYLKIIDARLDGKLDRVATQAQLIDQFNAPRNLVERVLIRMVDEGLIQRRKGRGWSFLPTFDITRSVQHGYQMRIALEPAAVLLPQFEVDHERLSAARIAHQDLLTSASNGVDTPNWIYGIDAEFHETIAAFSNNAFFLQAVQNQNRLRRLLEFRGYTNHRRTEDWCREHLAIIDALERGLLKKASELIRDHLENANDAAVAREAV